MSERDVSGVSALLDGASHAPGVDVVGWFATRARAGEALAMSGEDVEFQRRFFGEGGIVIVARADRQGDLEMALHRGTGESVKPEMMVRPTALERRSDLRKRAAAEAAPVTVEAAAGTGARGGRRWLWAGMAAAVAVCALAGWFWTRRAAEAAPVTVAGAATGKVETPMEMVSLHIEDVGARYRITWNGEAKVVLEAVKASLVIEDEGRVVRRELGTKAVRSGVQYYRSRGRRLKVALEMELRGGRRFREATVYGELRDEQMAEVRVGRVLEATN